MTVFARQYRAALGRYLESGRSEDLTAAEKVGRRAVVLGLETLDLAVVHEQALLARELPALPAAARNRGIKRAAKFFAEVILPLEETHRAAREANGRLNDLNRDLEKRTSALAAANRKLEKEIARRRAVEKTLRRSERHSRGLLERARGLQKELRFLSRRILSAQEEERKRISRELHDVIAQMLNGINVRLAALKEEAAVNTRGFDKRIARTQRLVEKSVDVVHRFALELRPAMLDDLGLIPALHSHMKQFTQETGIRVSLTAFAGVEELSDAKRTVLYRVAQEALANIARHSRATRVEAVIQREPRAVLMRIRDNGQSFNVEETLRAGKNGRIGLLGMRERVEMVGGRFSVESSPQEGTTIQARIPFRNGARTGVR